MIELAIVALVVSAIAGLWDLKTTEVPDEVAVFLTVFGLAFWYFAAMTFGTFTELAISAISGTVLLLIGLAMFNRGSWGEADAWILAGIAYTVPLLYGKLFIVDYIINFLLVGAIYMIIYALLLGARNRHVWKHVAKDIRKNARLVIAVPLAYAAIITGAAVWMFTSGVLLNVVPFIYILLVLVGLMLFWRYTVVLEQKVFRKRISTRQLKVGDVVSDKWIGATEKDIRKLRKQKYVTVKDGVRFVPAFALTLAVTLIWGNLLFLIL